MVYGVSFLDTLFSSLAQVIYKTMSFRTPLESSWAQNGTPNRPSGAKRREATKKTIFAGVQDPTFFPNRSRLILGGLAVHFWSVLGRCFAIRIEWLTGLMFWDTLFGSMFANVFPKSAKFRQNLPRSNKINQRIGRHKPASATCRNKSWNAELQKWGGGGVTPHGVFNNMSIHLYTYIYININRKQNNKFLSMKSINKWMKQSKHIKSTAGWAFVFLVRWMPHRNILYRNILYRIFRAVVAVRNTIQNT